MHALSTENRTYRQFALVLSFEFELSSQFILSVLQGGCARECFTKSQQLKLSKPIQSLKPEVTVNSRMS